MPVKWTESFVEPIELIEIQDDDDVVDDGLQSHESHAPQGKTLSDVRFNSFYLLIELFSL